MFWFIVYELMILLRLSYDSTHCSGRNPAHMAAGLTSGGEVWAVSIEKMMIFQLHGTDFHQLA